MSQPAGLFSVQRPRQTLGPITNYSGIPQPASAIKRASSSQDLRTAPYTAQHVRSTTVSQSVQRPAQPNFHRSSSGGNLAELGMSTARRSTSHNLFASVTAGRQSLAPVNLFGSQTPGSGNFQRRSSVYSRPSANGPGGHQSFFAQGTQSAIAPRDPRPLKDKTYQAKMAEELDGYLRNNGFFDLNSLSQNALKSPTLKDFNLIFQWLYKRLDPSYKFLKSMDAEVPPILKQLRYPYANSITKSAIAAVGGQNWSTFLGMLHWMMQLAQMLDNFQLGRYDDDCAEAGVDVSGDKIVFRFLFGAYQDWLQVGYDEDEDNADAALQPHIQVMAEEFERVNSQYVKELAAYEAKNEELKAQLGEEEKGASDIAKLDNNFKILEDDKKKFEDYNANVQAKVEKYKSRIQSLEDETRNIEEELQQSEQERLSLQQAVDSQGLKIQDIDRMNKDREHLTKSHDDAMLALEDLNKRVLEMRGETTRKLEDLEIVIKRYNSLGYQMSLIPSTASNARGAQYELSLNLSSDLSASTSRRRNTPEVDRLLADANVGYTPAHLINLDLRGAVRNAFSSLRKEIIERRTAAVNADHNARDLLDSIEEALAEKNSEISTLQYRVNEADRTYHSLRDSNTTMQTQQTSAIEKLEKDLARMREHLEMGVLELEQKEMEVGVAWEGMREEASRVREELHGGVERILEEVIRFKVHVQRGLEEFEGWVGQEVEGELLGESEDYEMGDGKVEEKYED